LCVQFDVEHVASITFPTDVAPARAMLAMAISPKVSARRRTPPTTRSEDLRLAAILFAPTLVGTIYGMNFEHTPELEWLVGYPFALALMLAASVSLY
jgi:hypothetical protein